ncbi:MAG TPA: C1 family peptidase [Terracidiphilus sp.]|nr:C1 family peptidase [Terracidiphilus sp.]
MARNSLEADCSPSRAELATRVDLRESPFGFPPVYDQCWLDSCTACAVSAVLAFDVRHRTPESDFEPSCLFLYYNERRSFGANGSAVYLRNCLTELNETGICAEREWPFDPCCAKIEPPLSAYRCALSRRNFDVVRLPRELPRLKATLAAGFPFVCGIAVHHSAFAPQVRRSGELPLPAADDPRFAVHAIAVTGYDDAGQRFFFRNSQGEQWGDGGYGTLPYAYLLDPNLATSFWVVKTGAQGA